MKSLLSPEHYKKGEAAKEKQQNRKGLHKEHKKGHSKE
jgi:hypothetical protein